MNHPTAGCAPSAAESKTIMNNKISKKCHQIILHSPSFRSRASRYVETTRSLIRQIRAPSSSFERQREA